MAGEGRKGEMGMPARCKGQLRRFPTPPIMAQPFRTSIPISPFLPS
eukprot:CAMPEP_0174893298 /NCGR_PEP_ID=MMETSP0167-20121228/8134_1 /TAXON_ID=38298 /ORGANISM="Rhodella maculata, Strain CCMP736" /LENGTH=45 /DNA_ID= /DNA_START= /DNA_END= /DNA_ORIENTATION=